MPFPHWVRSILRSPRERETNKKQMAADPEHDFCTQQRLILLRLNPYLFATSTESETFRDASSSPHARPVCRGRLAERQNLQSLASSLAIPLPHPARTTTRSEQTTKLGRNASKKWTEPDAAQSTRQKKKNAKCERRTGRRTLFLTRERNQGNHEPLDELDHLPIAKHVPRNADFKLTALCTKAASIVGLGQSEHRTPTKDGADPETARPSTPDHPSILINELRDDYYSGFLYVISSLSVFFVLGPLIGVWVAVEEEAKDPCSPTRLLPVLGFAIAIGSRYDGRLPTFIACQLSMASLFDKLSFCVYEVASCPAEGNRDLSHTRLGTMVKPCFRSEIQTQGHLDQLSIADLDVHALGLIFEKSQHLCYALALSLPFIFATTCAFLVVHERPSLSSLIQSAAYRVSGFCRCRSVAICWNWKHRAGLSHGEQRLGPERASCFLVVLGISLYRVLRRFHMTVFHFEVCSKRKPQEAIARFSFTLSVREESTVQYHLVI
ncbi:hypothetical protein I7I51_04804 [Histoplasma capsulatum]|uniref:Uncharacterized protein n=1 Tax=Ajellomyces capsulatus TaxID=5037 RepID=A0A8A1M0M3_AJECA|nr:hypothetical protein I7I51_04804 [Histoplasma capsulatum]